MKYAVVTFGCRVNQADSLGIEDRLRARGAIDAPPGEADLVVVNTCSVTASADQSARQVIRRLARANPQARIVVTGCYATRRPAELAALPNVIRVVANDHKDDLVGSLDFTEFTTAERFGDGDGPCGAHLQPGVGGRTALTLRVQTGCDEACSYCVIPSTRGIGRSRPLAGVLDDVRRATDAGYKEIAITGVHLGSYGRDLGDGTTLDRLVEALAGSPGDALFRISSLEPMDCPAEVIDLVAASGRFAPHFHLPLQHASDTVLRRMKRPYTLDVYRKAVDRVRHVMPDAAIGSDLIAGFPGETEEDAARTLDYVSGSPLTYLHVFPYSPRPDTDAARLPSRVPGPTVRARARALRDLGTTLSRRFRERMVGTVRAGLTLEAGTVVLTDNYLKVPVPPGLRGNQRVRVRVTSADPLAGSLA